MRVQNILMTRERAVVSSLRQFHRILLLFCTLLIITIIMFVQCLPFEIKLCASPSNYTFFD